MGGMNVQSIEGHAVIEQDSRFRCLHCGTRLLSAMQFATAECRGVQ